MIKFKDVTVDNLEMEGERLIAAVPHCIIKSRKHPVRDFK